MHLKFSFNKRKKRENRYIILIHRITDNIFVHIPFWGRYENIWNRVEDGTPAIGMHDPSRKVGSMIVISSNIATYRVEKYNISHDFHTLLSYTSGQGLPNVDVNVNVTFDKPQSILSMRQFI